MMLMMMMMTMTMMIYYAHTQLGRDLGHATTAATRSAAKVVVKNYLFLYIIILY